MSFVEGSSCSTKGAGSVEDATQSQLQHGNVSVWWDLENCPVPKDCKDILPRVTCNIIQAIRGLGFRGKISIHGYGNTTIFSEEVQNVLQSTGVRFIHILSDAADKKITTDMFFWAYKNPGASYLLISGDVDFKYALSKLKGHGCNIMLAGKKFSYDTGALTAVVWDWGSLLRGGTPRLTG
ncbi:uncharacterized protein [Henckelia pumila]|uniref:uncharacterized protein n=1 Tax=Henckelia pumila TaxID=405737 RepID=UPI003C6E5DAF